MTPSRVNLYAPRRTAPRLLQVLAFATLAAACLLAGSVTYQVTHLRGADISSATSLLRPVGLLIVASVLLTGAGSGMREHDRRRILLAHQQAEGDYARMMQRTAAIEKEIWGEVLSYSVQEWLDANRSNTGRDQAKRLTPRPQHVGSRAQRIERHREQAQRAATRRSLVAVLLRSPRRAPPPGA
jgi:hypothetical protein